MAHLRNCILCGTQYDYCPRCDETKPTFYLKYCSDNCKNISLILNKLNFKHLTKEEAAEELKKCDLAKLDKFNISTKKIIEDVMKAEEVVEEIVSVVDTYEAIPIREEETISVNEEIKPETKPNKKHKRKPIVNEI